jgi:tetratricopeptide (TPR) repeat protein
VDEHDTPLDELARLVRLRRAKLLSNRGDAAFSEGNRDEAEDLWQQARELAPEQEELAFWQALMLADEGDDIPAAVAVFNEAFTDRADREQWVLLVLRLEDARLIQREGAAQAFVAALRG